MKTTKIAMFATMLVFFLCFIGCEAFFDESNDSSYFKTTVGDADVVWKTPIDVPEYFNLYKIEGDNTFLYFDKAANYYGFSDDCIYEKGMSYEKDGIYVSIKSNGAVQIVLPKNENEYNKLSETELAEKAKEYLQNIGFDKKSLKATSYGWGFYEEGDRKGETYGCEVHFSQCTGEGYPINNIAVIVSFRNDNVYTITFKMDRISSSAKTECISPQTIRQKFKSVDLYPWEEISNITNISVDYAEIMYYEKTGKDGNNLYPFISFEGVMSNGTKMIKFESQGIQLFD